MKKALRKLQQSLQTPSRRSSLCQSRDLEEDAQTSGCGAAVCSQTSLSSEVTSAICTERTTNTDVGRVHSSPGESPVGIRPPERRHRCDSLYIDAAASSSSLVESSDPGSKRSDLPQAGTTRASSAERQMADSAAGNSLNAVSAPLSSLSMGRTGLTIPAARADSGNHDWGSVAESPLLVRTSISPLTFQMLFEPVTLSRWTFAMV